ncbi:hypothetical protein ABIB38_004820 [Massilia sp. UYP11]|uniref:hypothetical protein n=1 Tax=Massilia sp. UYP11 TaxID=1756385 RepID=UPI003D2209A5
MKNEKSIDKIKSAIAKLESEDRSITYSAVGEICGMSKQRVHQVMKMNEMNTGRTHDSKHIYIEKLKDVDTESLTINQIADLLEYTKAISTLRHVLHLLDIKCKRSHGRTSTREFLRTLPTENHTIEELRQISCYSKSVQSFRSFLSYNKIKYKKLRPS